MVVRNKARDLLPRKWALASAGRESGWDAKGGPAAQEKPSKNCLLREFRDCEFRLSNPDIRVLHGIQFPQQPEVKGQRGEPAPPVRIPIVKSLNKQLKSQGRGGGGGG